MPVGLHSVDVGNDSSVDSSVDTLSKVAVGVQSLTGLESLSHLVLVSA